MGQTLDCPSFLPDTVTWARPALSEKSGEVSRAWSLHATQGPQGRREGLQPPRSRGAHASCRSQDNLDATFRHRAPV